MRIGDVSRPRRFADPARLRWYAHHRAVRFARRMGRAHRENDAGPALLKPQFWSPGLARTARVIADVPATPAR